MILYKYVDFETGLKILETSSVGFSHLKDFNDPFESTAFGFVETGMVGKATQTAAYQNRFSAKYAVLSLTANPLNALMWAHYAVSHKGMVIGIDVEKAQLNHERFVIPAEKGKIEYFNKEPILENWVLDSDLLMSVGDDDIINLNNDNAKLLRHAFLYKQKLWAYEEEVRVVKNISYANFTYHHSTSSKATFDDQKWERLQLPTRRIYVLKIPKDAIVEVYAGKNSYIDQRRKYENNGNQIQQHMVPQYERLKQWCFSHQIDLYSVIIDHENWSLMKHKIIDR